MKKLFLVGVFVFGLLSTSFANTSADTNNANACAEMNTSDLDGWENLGKTTATAYSSHLFGDNYVFSKYEGTLYVKIIASQVLYKFVYQYKEYSVVTSRPGTGTGNVIINNERCYITLPSINV